jgi:predicted amidophosphoribosyltransferase
MKVNLRKNPEMNSASFDAISQLLYPVSCIICDEPGTEFCAFCAMRLRAEVSTREVDGVKYLAGAFYSDDLAKIILLAKESNDRSARRILTNYILEAFRCSQMQNQATIALVPLPSRKKANRRRGYKHATLLAEGLRSQLRRTLSTDVVLTDKLHVNRRILDQSNLSREERIANLAGAYSWGSRKIYSRVIGERPIATPREWILIDDLVTTGTSAKEAVRAMRASGFEPKLVISAATADRSCSRI